MTTTNPTDPNYKLSEQTLIDLRFVRDRMHFMREQALQAKREGFPLPPYYSDLTIDLYNISAALRVMEGLVEKEKERASG